MIGKRIRRLALGGLLAATTAVVPGAAGADIVHVVHYCQGIPATLSGGAGNDVLVGGAGNDVIVGLGGNDIIYGLSGNDRICGGPGDDYLFGENGKDVLFGEGNFDRMYGNAGLDRLHAKDLVVNETVDGGPDADGCSFDLGDIVSSC